MSSFRDSGDYLCHGPISDHVLVKLQNFFIEKISVKSRNIFMKRFCVVSNNTFSSSV